MSVLGQTILNAIENGVKKQYKFKELVSAQFVFNYIENKVHLNYSGIDADGSPRTGSTVKAVIDRNDPKFKMLSVPEADIEKKIGCKPSVLKMKVRADIGGFECECFFARDGKKVREVHLTKL